MIFADANVFLRYFVQPVTPDQVAMADAARALFEAAEQGDVELSTTVIVLHEVAYLLTAKSHYGFAVSEAAEGLSTILRLRGFRMPTAEKRLVLQALDLWTTHPVLGFSDAFLAVSALARGDEVASFDRDFRRIPGLRLRQL